jgi:deoxyribose-phosphate aldolase
MSLNLLAQKSLTLLDLTSLNDSDSDESIRALAKAADTKFGPPAALCVYPRFVATARQTLDSLGLARVPVATVANFPVGTTDIDATLADIALGLSAGAAEIDVVFPWRALLAGDADSGVRLLAACREETSAVTLKVIIESGALAEESLIRQAAEIAIAAGADFVKTSTGKTAVSATLSAAEVILQAIRASGEKIGFKASGGVRTVDEAAAYLALAEQIMGPDWITPKTFRFGASSLLGALLAALDARETVGVAGGY